MGIGLQNLKDRYILAGFLFPLLLPLILYWIAWLVDRLFVTIDSLGFGFNDYLASVSTLYAALLFVIMLVHYSSILSSKTGYYAKLCDQLLDNYDKIAEILEGTSENSILEHFNNNQRHLQSYIDNCRNTISILQSFAKDRQGGDLIFKKLIEVEELVMLLHREATGSDEANLFSAIDFQVRKSFILGKLYQLKVLHMDII